MLNIYSRVFSFHDLIEGNWKIRGGNETDDDNNDCRIYLDLEFLRLMRINTVANTNIRELDWEMDREIIE